MCSVPVHPSGPAPVLCHTQNPSISLGWSCSACPWASRDPVLLRGGPDHASPLASDLSRGASATSAPACAWCCFCCCCPGTCLCSAAPGLCSCCWRFRRLERCGCLGFFFVLFCCKSSALSHCEYQKSCSLCSWESSTPNARFFCFEDLSLVCVLCRFLCCPS